VHESKFRKYLKPHSARCRTGVPRSGGRLEINGAGGIIAVP